jgi:D-beta-D-heptose 7-phosphate kinase/D-beta-D-heptose 1-phosphate adenosyltransferase
VTPPRPPRSKVLGRAAAALAIAGAQRRRERVVLTSGCFDLLHVGHVRSLDAARRLGDRLVVGVNSDATVRRLKGAGRPVTPARQRAEILAALACVDWVVTFGEPTPRALLAALGPDIYAKGGDWPLDVLLEKDVPPGFAGRVCRLRQVPGSRTSLILERIRQGRAAGRRAGA